MSKLDLSPVGAAIFVFVMPECPACHNYMPVLFERARARAREGFVACDGACPLSPGQIPILLYDVTSTDTALHDLVRTYNITMTPTTLVLSRMSTGTMKLEGSLTAGQIDQVLDLAREVSR